MYEYRTFNICTFLPFNNRTFPVFRSPLYLKSRKLSLIKIKIRTNKILPSKNSITKCVIFHLQTGPRNMQYSTFCPTPQAPNNIHPGMISGSTSTFHPSSSGVGGAHSTNTLNSIISSGAGHCMPMSNLAQVRTLSKTLTIKILVPCIFCTSFF